MISVYPELEFLSDCLVIFFSLLLYYFFISKYAHKYLVIIIANSLLWGAMGMILYDFSYLFMVICAVIIDMIRQRKFRFNKSNVNSFILMLMLEIFLFISSGLVSEMIEHTFIKRTSTIYYVSQILMLNLLINLVLVIVSIIVINNKKIAIQRVRYKIESLDLGNRIFWMLFSLFIAFEVIIFVSDIEGVTSFIKGTIMVTFLFLLIFMIWQMIDLIQSFANKQKAIDAIQQSKQLNEYLTNIQEQYDDLRQFKHDFKNIVLSMNFDSKEKTNKSYEKLYNELSQREEFTSNLQGRIISEYKKISNEPLRGLVIQKFFKAKSKGINLNVEVVDDDYEIKNSILDVIRIVGILLDNAIEETVKTETKEIDLAFIKNKEVFEISVENVLNHQIDLKNIFKRGYSTKGEGHGWGLYNVNDMIAHNSELYLDSEIKDNKLRITLIIIESR